MQQRVMEVQAVLPLRLLWAWRRGDGSDASTLHACYARGIWRERGALERAAVLGAIFTWWPVSTLAMLGWCTAWNGPATRRRIGKAIWRQVVEQITVACRHSIAPPWYYIFDLCDDDKRAKAALYINRYETKRSIYNYLKLYLGGTTKGLADKLAFHEACVKHGLPTPPLVMVLEGGEIRAGGPRLPEHDLFVKPRKGCGGRGAERWEHLGEGRYRSHVGERCGEAELRKRLIERSLKTPQLVQRRLLNHPDLADLSTGALTTARMMTVLNEKGEYECTHAVFRTAIKRTSPVDNFHAGGIAAPVDMHFGELGPAIGGGLRGVPGFSDLGRSETHPLTGARVAGRRLPFWRDAVELVKQAHAIFPGLAVVGWDVGFTREGPVIIEGNSAPDLDIIQRCYGKPLGDTRLAAALAYHVRRARASLPPGPTRNCGAAANPQPASSAGPAPSAA